MKGIVLAAGKGTRLFPLTQSINKHLLPVYDKQMIRYPINTLVNMGIKEIIIIVNKDDLETFRNLLGEGDELGLHYSYIVQNESNGIVGALLLCEQYIGNDEFFVVLGDNIFFDMNYKCLQNSLNEHYGQIFVKRVQDPRDFGIVLFDKSNRPISIIEKPKERISQYAVTGLYHYSYKVFDLMKQIEYSERNELEISDLNNELLKQGRLDTIVLSKRTAWFDAGTFDRLLNASIFARRRKLNCSKQEKVISNINL